MTTLLKGVGFITGAASGIGKATARAFAKNGVRQLALGDINAKAIQGTAEELKNDFPGLEVLPLELNVVSENSIEEAVSKAVAQFGRIDYALNNAGIGGSFMRSAEHDLQDWQKVMDVNLNGVWMCQRAQIRQMLKQESREAGSKRHNRGVIVNMASMYGIVATSMNVPNISYTASKHGVIGLTRGDAIAYARDGIRINAICPGYVATPLLQDLMESESMQKEIERTPMNRLADMEEIADSIVFLASPMSSFMCGANMVVDGGFTIQ